VNLAHSLIGAENIQRINLMIRNLMPLGAIPVWNRYIPNAVRIPNRGALISKQADSKNKVVYIPSCLSRMFGAAQGNPLDTSLEQVTIELLHKANYQVIYPKNINGLCCGLSFSSKGFAPATEFLSSKLLDELTTVSENGRYPIICDSSPCVHHIRETIQESNKFRTLQFAVFEPIEFICCFIEKRLEWNQVYDSVLLHVPCSIKKLKLQTDIERIAQKCAKEVVNTGISCCGMAGDRGIRFPEMGQSACSAPLARALTDQKPSMGFSTSATCEIQLSNQANLHFANILHLINAATK
jgi:D-lactate dehydrogenase